MVALHHFMQDVPIWMFEICPWVHGIFHFPAGMEDDPLESVVREKRATKGIAAHKCSCLASECADLDP